MMDHSKSGSSEVARLLKQIEAEYIAAKRGLTGFAENARHAFITVRMENIGKLHEHLCTLAGDDAMRLIAERLETLPLEQGGIQ